MDVVLQLFEPREPAVWLFNVLLVTLASLAALWGIAMILARVAIVVERDIEMKVHFAASIALLMYSIVMTLLAILLALEYSRLDYSVFYALPWCTLATVAVILIFGLNAKISARIATHTGRRSRS